MTRRPATNQREFKFDRAKQLKLRSAVKLPPAEKFILWIIDDHIGGKRSWTLTYGKIAEESGYTERCVRKAVAALDEHLIVWTKRASNHYHDQRREYFIDWQNLEELVDEQSKANKEPTDEPPLDPEPRSEIVNDDPQSGTSFANRERSSAIVNVVPDSISTTTAPLTAPTTAHSPPPSPPSAPPPAVDEFADQKTAVVVMVKECGVGQFVKAVDNALAAGMTLEQIRQVFQDHFQGQWVVDGRIYSEEILLRVGRQKPGQLAQVNIEVSVDFYSSEENGQECIDALIDAAATLMTDFLAQKEQDADGLPPARPPFLSTCPDDLF